MFQEDPGYINFGFYERMRVLRINCQRLIHDDMPSKAILSAIKTIRYLDEEVRFITTEESLEPNFKLRRDILINVMSRVLDSYTLAGRDSELDFCGSDIEDYI